MSADEERPPASGGVVRGLPLFGEAGPPGLVVPQRGQQPELLAAAAQWLAPGLVRSAVAREQAEVQVRLLLDATRASSEDVAARVAALLRSRGRGDLADDPLSPDSLGYARDLLVRGDSVDFADKLDALIAEGAAWRYRHRGRSA